MKKRAITTEKTSNAAEKIENSDPNTGTRPIAASEPRKARRNAHAAGIGMASRLRVDSHANNVTEIQPINTR